MKPQSQGVHWIWFVVAGLAVLLLAIIAANLMRNTPPPAPPAPVAEAPSQPQAATIPDGPAPPARLAAEIEALGRSFDGKVGIVVQSIGTGWRASFAGDSVFPQQSVSKMWVAAAVMDQIDQGQLRLTDPLTLTPADLTIFHQPIRKRIGNGRYTSTISELLWFAMTQSDNTANEALFRRVGGKAGVGNFLARKALDGIAMGPGERDLQVGAAGMAWDDSYSYGRTFWRVRETVPVALRASALASYVTDPPDGATPHAVASGLAKLARGEMLSRASSAYLMGLMNQSKTGPDRLKSGLSEGWTLAHKTGTGQVLGVYATAYNDVGILSGPGGQQYAIVVMIASTRRPVPERQALMAAVTRAAIASGATQVQR